MNVAKIGTILYAIVVAVFGFNHFMNAGAMSGYVPSYMPGGGSLWVYITGVALILAAISIIIGKKTKLACYLLALLLIIFVLTLHLPPLLKGDQMAMGSVLKDTAMAAAALIIGGNSKE
jgi:putative oxidoreductase